MQKRRNTQQRPWRNARREGIHNQRPQRNAGREGIHNRGRSIMLEEKEYTTEAAA